MPLFFFDTHNGERLVRDTIGQELPDRHVARQNALEAFPDMARDEIPDGDWKTLYVNVRDASGQVIYTACMSLVGRWLD